MRTVIRWARRPDQQKKFLYEERITAWNAGAIETAIEEAAAEARAYADEGDELLDLFQACWIPEEIAPIPQGLEVFSLLRESDLGPSDYLDAFFDTGSERQGE